ncbi:MAG: lipoyl synthase [Pseudomonadota bacterium]
MSSNSNRNPLKGYSKTSKIPIKIVPSQNLLRKPAWIRSKLPGNKAMSLLRDLKKQNLNTVCTEAACPNLSECFTHGTATFMILGDICTRRCPFCDVAHGKPETVDKQEPMRLAKTIAIMGLRYVVITSVDRDDLRDGGASHFSDCIKAIRKENPNIEIEILTPDFRGRMDIALEKLQLNLPNVFNHNLETVPDLYKKIRPGADYLWSLSLLKKFHQNNPSIPTKSGLMLGLGETKDQVIEVLYDMRSHNISWLTLGQYLQPSIHHLPVSEYITPQQFEKYADIAKTMGFTHVASGPMVRSSYHADKQASGEQVK